jgi:hypothetical protein
MDLVPRIFCVAIVVLALAGGSGAAFAEDMALADGAMPENGGLLALPALLPPPHQDSLMLTDRSSSFGVLSQKPDPHNGSLDFFSARPETSSRDFTSLLHSGVAGGGLKFKFKW